MSVVMCEMNIEFCSRYRRLLAARDMEVIAIEAQFFQLMFEFVEIETQIDKRPQQHVAADPAKNIQVEYLHPHQLFWASVFIWLAA